MSPSEPRGCTLIYALFGYLAVVARKSGLSPKRAHFHATGRLNLMLSLTNLMLSEIETWQNVETRLRRPFGPGVSTYKELLKQI